MHTIAHVAYIKKNCEYFSTRTLASRTSLTFDTVEKILKSIDKKEANKEQSIDEFKKSEKRKLKRKQVSQKAKAEALYMQQLTLEEKKKKFIIIPPDKEESLTRPAAIYTNINWKEYLKNL